MPKKDETISSITRDFLGINDKPSLTMELSTDSGKSIIASTISISFKTIKLFIYINESGLIITEGSCDSGNKVEVNSISPVDLNIELNSH